VPGLRLLVIGGSDAGSAIIVGGGDIGLEIAEAFTARGLEVTLVEQAPAVMPTVDPEPGELLGQELGRHEIQVVNDVTIKAIHQEAGGLTVAGEPDFAATADLVLVVVGVRPDTDLAHPRHRPVPPHDRRESQRSGLELHPAVRQSLGRHPDGRPDLDPPHPRPAADPGRQPRDPAMTTPASERWVLFVCTHNAGRSIVAAALLNAHQPPGVRADSAGTDPSDAARNQHWQLGFPGDDLEAMGRFCDQVDQQVQALLASLQPPTP
jgi:hypothetical protein